MSPELQAARDQGIEDAARVVDQMRVEWDTMIRKQQDLGSTAAIAYATSMIYGDIAKQIRGLRGASLPAPESAG